MIFVPVRDVRASVSGAVIRPAICELKPGQTLRDVVEAAGGFRPRGIAPAPSPRSEVESDSQLTERYELGGTATRDVLRMLDEVCANIPANP